jgi:hypothetical protein
MTKQKQSKGVLFSGIIQLTGEADTGKTMFAVSSGASPEDTVFIDDDLKSRSIIDQIREQGHELGMYIDLTQRGAGMKEIELHKEGLKILDELDQAVQQRGKPFEVLIWDTWARFENTFWPWVATYPQTFKSYWSPKGDIKGAEQWQVSFVYEAEFMSKLQKYAKLVILTSHLKPDTINGKKTGKFIPDCKRPVVQKCLMRVYLRHNPDSPAPIGLILKRISKQVVTDEGIEIVSVLPRKMKPFTWKAIRSYWADPVGDRPLNDSEKPDEWELSILDGTLTDDQKEILRITGTDDEMPAPLPTPDFSPELVSAVKSDKASGKPLPKIATDNHVSIADVTKILSM